MHVKRLYFDDEGNLCHVLKVVQTFERDPRRGGMVMDVVEFCFGWKIYESGPVLIIERGTIPGFPAKAYLNYLLKMPLQSQYILSRFISE